MNEDHVISDLKQLPVLEFQPEVVTQNLGAGANFSEFRNFRPDFEKQF